jgi:transcriptional regulator with XRE-family HTH domain
MTITRAHVERETKRRLRRLHLHVGDDVRRLRLDAGLTLTELGAVVGVHRSHLARIEAGVAAPTVSVLTAIGVALGADLGVRYFAGSGPRLIDRFQALMIEEFVRSLHPRWTVRLEVPVSHPARAIVDAALIDRASPIAIASEVQSELRRLEQRIRWNNEKADGLAARLAEEAAPAAGRTVSRLLVLRSTTSTREIARRYEATLAVAYPSRAEDVIRALTTASAPWPGSGIAWMRVEAGQAVLLHHPPRGVRLGR